MKDFETKRTGIITCGENNYSFCVENYNFTFLHKSLEWDKVQEIKSDDDFIYGKTYDRHDIAIYIGKNRISFGGSLSINMGAYLVSMSNVWRNDLTFFESIEFVGGTLNNLLARKDYGIKYINEEKMLVSGNNIVQEYDFKIDDENCHLEIYTSLKSRDGVHGFNISDYGVTLKLKFEKRQSLQTVFKHVNKIKEIISFMTYRYNVGFDEIYLWQYSEMVEFETRTAQLFIRNDEELTQKEMYKCIDFDDLGDKLVNLLELFYTSKDKKVSYSLGFYPEKDNNAWRMSDSKVREICSGVECELNFIDDLCSEEEVNLKALVEQVKDVVKNHRKSGEKLSNKTYDLIYGNIKHWSMAAGDRIYQLYERYQEELLILDLSNKHIGNEAIEDFVKYRNHITHGTHRVMDISIAETAFVLAGLTYCCLLTRIGISRDKIKELCREHKILG